MTKKNLLINTILSAALFCSGVTLAQTPVQNIDKNAHSNLAEAQSLVVQANQYIIAAQEYNKNDMKDHAAKARQLLVQVNQELKLAAEAADAANVATSSTRSGLDATIPSNSSPELVSQLTKELSITPTQAGGGAGALFALAKTRLSAEEFSKVAAAVPGMNGLLNAAPAATELSGLSGLRSSLPAGLGGLGSLAPVAGSFQKLGLSPEMAGKFVPVLTNYVQSKGGISTASLLAKVLQ